MADLSCVAEVYVGLGSNLGDRREHLRLALDRVAERCVVQKVSSLYETDPVGCPGPERFLNAAAQVETALDPRDLLEFLRSIEADEGRVRRIRNDPRTVDLDILLYADRIIDEDDVQIPHPRLHERGFVLIPLAEIAPDLVHPVLSAKVSDLASQSTDRAEVTLVETNWWHPSEVPLRP